MIKINFENKKITIAGLVSSKLKESESFFSDLEDKIKIGGGIIVGQLIQRKGVSRSNKPGGSQKLESPLDSSTFIGKGKVNELKELCNTTKSDLVVFINQLSLSQKERLEQLIE